MRKKSPFKVLRPWQAFIDKTWPLFLLASVVVMPSLIKTIYRTLKAESEATKR